MFVKILGSIEPKASLKPWRIACTSVLSSEKLTPKEKYAVKAKANNIFETG